MSTRRSSVIMANPQLAGLIQEAVRHGKDVMDGLLRQTRDALQRQIDMTRDADQRDAKAMVVSSLVQSGPDLRARFPDVLRKAFEAELGETPATTNFDGATSSGLKFEELELMDENEVQNRISVTRGMQQALMEAEHELTELNALVSAILGFDQVRAERNPFRPEIFVAALQTLLQDMQAGMAAKSQISQIMAPLLGRALRPIYRDLLSYLHGQRVQPVRYVINRPAGGAAAAGSGRAPAGRVEVTKGAVWGAESRSALLAAHGGGVPPAGGKQASGMPSGHAPSAGLSLAPAHVDPAAQSHGGQLTVQQLHGLISGASRGANQLVQEVVNLIISSVLSDEHILPPLRQLLASLEHPLLHMANTDLHFFSDKQHPARVLIEEITQKGFAFDNEESSEFQAFLKPVQKVLAAIPVKDTTTADFVRALARMRQRWQMDVDRRQEKQQVAVQALQQAERRNTLAEQLAANIRSQKEAALVPDVVVDFACGPWSQVMAQAQLEGKVDAAGEPRYLAVLEDLFWSVRPDKTRKNPARLVKLIPELIKSLREGLATIRYDEAKTSAFLAQLFALHQGSIEAKSAERAPRPATPPQRTWLAPQEARESGFMEDWNDDIPVSADSGLATDFPTTETMSLEDRNAETGHAALEAAPTASAGSLNLEQLQLGDWLELAVESRWVRLQLAWLNEQATLCLFSAGNGKNHSMTRRMFDRLVQQGQLRLLSQGPVVDRAFNAVAELAMRNSVFIDLQEGDSVPPDGQPR